jgi:xanthine dehydrogenase accessory factor
MRKELELWQFIHDRLSRGENVILLIVAASKGSSPGRAGYKMAVAADGELCGSIGGGVMEVNLVEQSRRILSAPPTTAGETVLIDQVHQENSPDASGMICSGKQTVILKKLTAADAELTSYIVDSLVSRSGMLISIDHDRFVGGVPECPTEKRRFYRFRNNKFSYSELLWPSHELFIIGGGHCALALSELISKLDFHILIFDDRPDLNTIAKNEFADEVIIIESYESIDEHLRTDAESYVVVMTLGYASDKVVIKQLCDRDFKYFGVLGSKAKMATLMKELREEGIPDEQLARIRTPIGLPIKSRTPEEIAVSIAAEIIKIKNSKVPREQFFRRGV